MNDKIIAAVRTGAAALGVVLIGWLATTVGLDFPDEIDAQIIAVIGVLAVALWNLIANWLADKWPALGYLLVIPRQPTYTSSAQDPLDDSGEIRLIEAILVVLVAVVIVLIAVRL